jgi:ABC-type multidrug transport system ATPase subunit
MSVTRFGQLVIGPPGSGKTTYVKAMSDLLRRLNRKIAIVNLGKPFNKIPGKGTVSRAVLGLVLIF